MCQKIVDASWNLDPTSFLIMPPFSILPRKRSFVFVCFFVHSKRSLFSLVACEISILTDDKGNIVSSSLFIVPDVQDEVFSFDPRHHGPPPSHHGRWL